MLPAWMKYETIMENQKLDLPKQNYQKQNKAKLMEGDCKTKNIIFQPEIRSNIHSLIALEAKFLSYGIARSCTETNW